MAKYVIYVAEGGSRVSVLRLEGTQAGIPVSTRKGPVPEERAASMVRRLEATA